MKAVARYVRIPPRKARLAIDLVRGKPVNEALIILQRRPTSRRASHARCWSLPSRTPSIMWASIGAP